MSSSSSVIAGNIALVLLVKGDDASFDKYGLSLVSLSMALFNILLVSGTRISLKSTRGTALVGEVEPAGGDSVPYAPVSGSFGGSTRSGFLGASLKSLFRKSRQLGRCSEKDW